MKPIHPLMLVTNCRQHDYQNYLHFIEECLANGVNSIQLRQKQFTPNQLLAFGNELKELCTRYHASFIINDDIELALALDADGVHLGQSDGEPERARKRLGPDKIIGLSIESHAQLSIANNLPLNYVAASAIFPSNSKHNLKKLWGIDGLTDFCKQSAHPVIAIGGINLNNINQVKETGVDGVAVIEALHSSPNLKQTLNQLLR